ncbi:alpha/beta hydrolase [Chelatococcus sp. GCM10030263]|uniref:alpha/beta hydrolase n=1 Tax=Chelatococcus sp. GCM10030263 TaxID=3273387 RepID=UPI003613D0FB
MPLELITVTTADHKELDGALYRPEGERPKVGVLVVHGLTWNFYRGPSRWLPPLLTMAGHLCLSLNMRDHDLAEPVEFEQSHHDIKAGIDFLAAEGGETIILLAHGYGCNKAVCYPALSGDHRVEHYILTTLGSVKAYRPDIWDKVLACAPALRGKALVVQGAVDPLIEGEPRAAELVDAAREAAIEVVFLDGADHYFADTHQALADTIIGWAERA